MKGFIDKYDGFGWSKKTKKFTSMEAGYVGEKSILGKVITTETDFGNARDFMWKTISTNVLKRMKENKIKKTGNEH